MKKYFVLLNDKMILPTYWKENLKTFQLLWTKCSKWIFNYYGPNLRMIIEKKLEKLTSFTHVCARWCTFITRRLNLTKLRSNQRLLAVSWQWQMKKDGLWCIYCGSTWGTIISTYSCLWPFSSASLRPLWPKSSSW